MVQLETELAAAVRTAREAKEAQEVAEALRDLAQRQADTAASAATPTGGSDVSQVRELCNCRPTRRFRSRHWCLIGCSPSPFLVT